MHNIERKENINPKNDDKTIINKADQKAIKRLLPCINIIPVSRFW